MIRSIAAAAVVVLVIVSVSGAEERPPEPISTELPPPQFGSVGVAPERLFSNLRGLGPGAPEWARQMYMDSVSVLLRHTDPESGAQLAGARQGWDRVWPRDAAAGAIALEAAGAHLDASRVVEHLNGLDLDASSQFEPDGEPIPGRGPAGDAEGWVATAAAAVHDPADSTTPEFAWRDRQDYGENVTGVLLGNAIAAGAPAEEILKEFETERGLTRVAGGEALDSAAAWAVVPFGWMPEKTGNEGGGPDRTEAGKRRLRGAVRRTLLAMAAAAGPYGIAPAEGWKYDDGWTAPTAWTAAALAELGEIEAADRMLAALRAARVNGLLPERVDMERGEPLSTTPLVWSHAWAILALRARYPGRK